MSQVSHLSPDLHAEYEKWTVEVPIHIVDQLMESNLHLYAKYMGLRSLITKNDFVNIEDEPYPPHLYKVDHAIWSFKKTVVGISTEEAVHQYAAAGAEIMQHHHAYHEPVVHQIVHHPDPVHNHP